MLKFSFFLIGPNLMKYFVFYKHLPVLLCSDVICHLNSLDNLFSVLSCCFCQVLSDKGGFGVAWFSAKVIDINENSAVVSYDNHNGEYLSAKSPVNLLLLLLPVSFFLFTFSFCI